MSIQRRRRSTSILEEFRMILQEISKSTTTIVMMNEEQFPLNLTTDDVETILDTMALLALRFIPIHNQVGDATSISTSSGSHSIDLEDVQLLPEFASIS